MTVYHLENPIINNDWGCPKTMVELYGYQNPDNRPLAELWMGAHPKAVSFVNLNNKQHMPLSELIANEPVAVLGPKCAKKFTNELSFLFKVLSADSPLSIQSHPNKAQAIAGWEKENIKKIPLSAPHRNYKDKNHKPELVYAITEFHALNGFREYDQIIQLFNLIKGPKLTPIVEKLTQSLDSSGLKSFYYELMTHPTPSELVNEAINNIKQRLNANTAPESLKELWQLALDINSEYPGDIGVLSPFLINHIILQPGEAMFLNAGTLHAYLKGTSLEIMANSDNVLRGGLTHKHIDIKELLHTTVFEPKKQNDLTLNAVKISECEQTYHTDVDDFKLSIITLESNTSQVACTTTSAEILFVIEGAVSVTTEQSTSITLNPGQSCFISAQSKVYHLLGKGKVARASTPV
ncbi:mannose-6-phosphate isomerase, class I [Pseudoalteromonas sp. 1CM17D]|uniref:mannose-6-phosphate isomerase, class I n=1 Tax=Pseudoalteromonas sp. 1CM17D TaxID=2929162 RepID=UPI0020BEDB7A|nr:mannose-6-phosphate isomerase, class I [Pseudoalteromonas sp. 1CM17D]MCK8097417.1 mannose-6-phosphate isomerase, class I [Pseudoalteromonas sp. 1CM17D]